MSLDRGLASGSTAMLIMRLLSERAMYGYEMITELSQRSGELFALKEGTLYPLLHQLEKERLVEAYESEVGGRKRRYYRLTSKGSGRLEDKKREWADFSRAVDNILALA